MSLVGSAANEARHPAARAARSSADASSPSGVGPIVAAAPRLDSLTGMRFIAALMVFGVHSSAMFDGTVLPALLAPGAIGVSFFFKLSGFVLT
jgi:hypothetical protein